jgi:hypothetical protein
MKRKEVDTVKTTIELPEDLWREAKMLAIDERTDLRSVVIAALETHLRHNKSPKRKG